MNPQWEEKLESLARGHQSDVQDRIEALKVARQECADFYNDVITVTFGEIAEKWRSMEAQFDAEAEMGKNIGDVCTLKFKFNNKNVLQISVKASPSPLGAFFSGTTADFNPVQPPIPIRFAGAEEIRASVVTQDALAELVTGRLEAALKKHLPEK